MREFCVAWKDGRRSAEKRDRLGDDPDRKKHGRCYDDGFRRRGDFCRDDHGRRHGDAPFRKGLHRRNIDRERDRSEIGRRRAVRDHDIDGRYIFQVIDGKNKTVQPDRCTVFVFIFFFLSSCPCGRGVPRRVPWRKSIRWGYPHGFFQAGG